MIQAVDDLGLEPPKVDGDAGAGIAPEKARITALEQQLASLRSENLELRHKVARYEHVDADGQEGHSLNVIPRGRSSWSSWLRGRSLPVLARQPPRGLEALGPTSTSSRQRRHRSAGRGA
ncbi:hypothetical protein F2981_13960 [Sinorhizobium meliloti]|nr:hypothetical protein [Sinorhizobium meliloti]